MKPETLLLRQVHPVWLQQNRITSQVFRPTSKDQKKLSVYDGDQISPENSWKHYTEEMEYKSVGVMGVTEEECRKLVLTVKSDPMPFPEHALIDFSLYSENQIKQKSKHLKVLAESRGWLYHVNDSKE